MHDIVIEGIQVVVFLAQGYLLQLFFGNFMKERFAHSRWSTMGIIIAFGILRYGIYVIFPTSPQEGTIGILSRVVVLTFCCVLAIALCFYQGEKNLRIFLVVTFMAVCECCFFLAYMVMQMGQHLTNLWTEFFDKGLFASTESFLMTVEVSLTVLLVSMYAVYIILTNIFLKKIVKCFQERKYVIQSKELWFLLSPGLVGLLLCAMLRIIMIAVEDGIPKLLYDRYPPLMWVVPAILLLSLMAIWFAVKLFQDMIDLHREKSERIILEKQLEGMRAQMKEIERIYSEVRSMKHDFKNTLAVVMQLAGKGGAKNEELQGYISALNKCFERLEISYQTGNPIVDVLLTMKEHELKKNVPDARLDAESLIFSENIRVESFDLGIIIGNALDNALEACEKLKCQHKEAVCFVRLRSFWKGKMLFVEVENPFWGKLLREPHMEFPKTDKQDKEAHGMGLANIKNTAEKYDGAVDWTADGGVFTLSVMMKNERRREDVYQ